MSSLEGIAGRTRWTRRSPTLLAPALLAAALALGCHGTGRPVPEEPAASTLEAPVERVVDDLLDLAQRRADTSAMRVQLAAIEPALADARAAERTFVGGEPWPAAGVGARQHAPAMQRELHHELTLLLARRLHLIDAPLASPVAEAQRADPAWIEKAVEQHGATHVLLGDLEERGRALVLSLRLVDARSGLIVAAARGPIPPESFSATIDPAPVPAAAPAVVPYAAPSSSHRIASSSIAVEPASKAASEPAWRASASPAEPSDAGLKRDPATGLLLPAYVPRPSPELRFREPGSSSASGTEGLEAPDEGTGSAIPPLTEEELSSPWKPAADLSEPAPGASPASSSEPSPASSSSPPAPAFRSSPPPEGERPAWVQDVVRRYGPGGDRYEEARELEGPRPPASRPPPVEREPKPSPDSAPAPEPGPPEPAGEAPPWIRELIERYRSGGPRAGSGEA